MVKVGVYMRVSTKEQDIGSQKMVIKDYCLRNNFEIYREYSDHGYSGAQDSRPQLNLMLNDMRQNHFQVVICYKLDRIGRSLRHLLDIVAEFKNKGVRLISISDNLDTANDNPMNRAFMQLLSVFSELERSIICERVRCGLLSARKNGKLLGRPVGSRDKRKRSISGYLLRYHQKSKEERRLGSRRRLSEI
jgi:DNA invertase Pin-like site-specific DNA recombinase